MTWAGDCLTKSYTFIAAAIGIVEPLLVEESYCFDRFRSTIPLNIDVGKVAIDIGDIYVDNIVDCN